MIYAAVGLALLSLVMAWMCHRKNSDLRERIAQVNSRVYHLRRELQDVQEANSRDLSSLKFELLKVGGNLTITPEMRVGEVLMLHPQAQQVLAGFHIGGCSSCSVDDRQTLGEAFALNGREPEPILAALNTLVAEGQNGEIDAAHLKTPNIELQF